MRSLLVLITLALAATAQGADASAGIKPEAPGIAVLRLDDALTAFKMFISGMERVKAEFAKGKAEIGDYQAQMEDDDRKLHVLNPGSDLFTATELQYEQLKTTVDFTVERGNRALYMHRAQVYRTCYAYLHASLAAFCADKGIKLVHLAPNPVIDLPDEHDTTPQIMGETLTSIHAQSILFYTPDLDITDAFVVYLNDHWTNDAAEQAKEGSEKVSGVIPPPTGLPGASDSASTQAAPAAPAPAPGPVTNPIQPMVAPAPAATPGK